MEMSRVDSRFDFTKLKPDLVTIVSFHQHPKLPPTSKDVVANLVSSRIQSPGSLNVSWLVSALKRLLLNTGIMKMIFLDVHLYETPHFGRYTPREVLEPFHQRKIIFSQSVKSYFSTMNSIYFGLNGYCN